MLKSILLDCGFLSQTSQKSKKTPNCIPFQPNNNKLESPQKQQTKSVKKSIFSPPTLLKLTFFIF